jgi:SOS-response transcriptional repressor LexA
MAIKNLGERIKEARLKSGLKQTEAAAKLNIAFQTFNKYEKNHRVPDAELLSSMAHMFECDPGWLLSGLEYKTEEKKRERNVESTNSDKKRLIEALTAFGKEHKLLLPTEFADLINIPNPYLADLVTGSGRRIFYSWAAELDRCLKNFLDLRLERLFDKKEDRHFYYQKVSSIPVLEGIPVEFPKIPIEDVLETLYLTAISSNSFAFVMDGDSMNPTIYDGDYVLFRAVKNEGECVDGDIVVAFIEEFQSVVIKRVSVNFGSVTLKSDNEEYPFYNIGQYRHKIKIVGKAFKILRTIDL